MKFQKGGETAAVSAAKTGFGSATKGVTDAANQAMGKIDSVMESYSKSMFLYTTAIMYLLYVLVVFGISTVAPELLSYLEFFFRLFICLFLLIRFNPLRKHTCTEADGRIIFAAALLMLSTQGLTHLAMYFLSNLKWAYNTYMMYM
jgi:hypothetical protein